MSRTMFITAKETNAARLSFDPSKAINTDAALGPVNPKSMEFENIAPEGSSPVRINSLAILVMSLKQLVEHKQTRNSRVYVPDTLGQAIHFKNYLTWILDGKTKSGVELSEVELKLWNEFRELYATMDRDVSIVSISYTKVKDADKASEYSKRMELLANMAWNLVSVEEDEVANF